MSKKDKPKTGELWQRNAGTLPALYAVSKLQLFSAREQAYIRKVENGLVLNRRDPQDLPATHMLALAVFRANFTRILTPRRGPALSDLLCEPTLCSTDSASSCPSLPSSDDIAVTY